MHLSKLLNRTCCWSRKSRKHISSVAAVTWHVCYRSYHWGCRKTVQCVEWNRQVRKHRQKNKIKPLFKPWYFQEVKFPFKTVGTCRWQSWQQYTPVAFTPQNIYFWCSFLLESESTPGPLCGWKDYEYVNEWRPVTLSGIEPTTSTF